MSDALGRCALCPRLSDPGDVVEELRHHAREVAEAPTPQATRRLRLALDRVDPDVELDRFLEKAVLTIIDGHACHAARDALAGQLCPCRGEGTPHEVRVADTYDALATLVLRARALYHRTRETARA